MKINLICPIKADKHKMNQIRLNSKKILNIIKIRCINYLDMKNMHILKNKMS